jgi:hypothetical protein
MAIQKMSHATRGHIQNLYKRGLSASPTQITETKNLSRSIPSTILKGPYSTFEVLAATTSTSIRSWPHEHKWNYESTISAL